MERIDPLTERPSIVAEHKHRYQVAQLVAFGDVLDCACGLGYGSELLLQKPEVKSYTGVDISTEAIELASSRYKNSNTKFLAAEAAKLPFPDSSFDTVVSLETLEHLDSPEIVIKEFNRVLKPGGLLIASAPTIEHDEFCEQTFGKNPYHHYRFTEQILKNLLSIVGPCKLHLARIISLAELVPFGEDVEIKYCKSKLSNFGSYIGVARKGGEPPSIPAEAAPLLTLVEVESEITKAYDYLVNDRDAAVLSYKNRELELRKALSTAETMAVERLQAINAYIKTDTELRAAFSRSEEMIRERDALIKELNKLLDSKRSNG